jgi:uracil phosphoribosyltransferase
VIGAVAITVIEHPLIADRIALLRDAGTSTELFRRTVEELSVFLAYEATRSLRTEACEVRTPLGPAQARRIAGNCVIAPILRAGLGLLPGFSRLLGDAATAHLGFYRDPKTLEAIPYYANIPENLSQCDVFVLDPMLATGSSACAAIQALVSRGARTITFVCLIAAPEGIAVVRRAHPEARIVVAAIDEKLNEHGYILPGLGDAGDRMFGSKSSVPVVLTTH